MKKLFLALLLLPSIALAGFTGGGSGGGVLSVPAGTSVANAIQFGGSATTGFYSTGTNALRTGALLVTDGLLIAHAGVNFTSAYAIAGGTFNLGVLTAARIAVTIATGFGTAPTIVGASTAAFKVTIGAGGAASGVLTFPAATTGWAVDGVDATNYSTIEVVCVSTSTTSVTVYAFDRVTGLASTFSAGDVLQLKALGF